MYLEKHNFLQTQGGMEECAKVCLKRVYRGYLDYSPSFQCPCHRYVTRVGTVISGW